MAAGSRSGRDRVAGRKGFLQGVVQLSVGDVPLLHLAATLAVTIGGRTRLAVGVLTAVNTGAPLDAAGVLLDCASIPHETENDAWHMP